MTRFAYVTIKLNEKMTDDEVRAFINESLINISIESVGDNQAVIRWDLLSEQDEIYDIEETMFYILKDGEVGDYSYTVHEE